MKRIVLAILLALVPITMSIWDLEEKFSNSFPILKPVLVWVPFVTVGLFLLLIVTAVIELLSWWIELYYRAFPSALRNISVTACKADDLPKVVEIASTRIGSTTSDIEKTKELYAHNKKSIWKVRDTISNEIVGYFCILPLTAKGEKLVKERDLLIGELDPSNFARNFRKGIPVYIGGIAGQTRKASAAALEHLKGYLVRIEATKAYARPVTDEGVRLVKRHGVEAVSEHDAIAKGVYVCRLRQI